MKKNNNHKILEFPWQCLCENFQTLHDNPPRTSSLYTSLYDSDLSSRAREKCVFFTLFTMGDERAAAFPYFKIQTEGIKMISNFRNKE